MRTKILYAGAVAFLISACNPETKTNTAENTQPQPKPAEVPVIEFSTVNTFPHDTMAFTEGFLFHEGQLFESTGSPDDQPKTRSLFGSVDLKTGRIDVKAELDREKYFGEGIAFFNDKVYQLTYKNQQGFIYDATTFKPKGTFTYDNKEGWGMTTDGTYLIMSDGTDKLTYLDPNTLKPAKILNVSENGYALDYINELEFIKGYIYANVWTTNFIVKIDPANGKVIGKLILTPLQTAASYKYSNSKETNGIAYDASTDKIYVTGKLWPSIYEISFPH